MSNNTQQHRSQIGNLTVASASPYVVYGEVRGLVSEHRLLRTAQQSLQRDQDACRSLPGGTAYSDAYVYCWDDEDGWCLDANSDVDD